MKDIYVYEDETGFITIKHSGKYYPFGHINVNGKEELLGIIRRLDDNYMFNAFSNHEEVKEKISKLDFISLEEWLILN